MKYVRYLAALVVMALLSFAIMFSAYNQARTDAINQLYAQEKILARQAAEGITAFFGYHKETADFFVHNDDVIYNTPQGQELLREYYASQAGSITAVTRVSPQGIILYSWPDETVIGRDISAQIHVQKVMTEHFPVVSNVFMAAQGYRSIALHIPVFGRDGFAGSLGILIPFEKISRKFVENIRIGESGYAYLLSADGTELYCPVPGHIGMSIYETSRDFPSILAMADQALKKAEGSFVYNFNQIAGQKTGGTTKYAYVMPVTLEDTFWVIIVATPEDEALSFIEGFRDRWILGLSILVIVFLVWAYFLGRAYLSMHRENLLKAAQKEIDAAESERKKAAAFLDSALMQSSMGIIITDAANGKVLMENPAALQILGGSITSTENAHQWQGFRSDQSPISPQEHPLLRATLRGETVQNEELFFHTTEGSRRWISVNAAPIHNEQGEIIAGVTIFRDITGQKAAEEEIRLLNTTLEQRVQQRTAELQAANKELESFSYTVSHDLRAPVRSIDGFSRILQESMQERMNSEEQGYLKRILKAARRMDELIDGLLEFSHLGRQSFVTRGIPGSEIARMVNAVIEELNASDPQRRVEWRLGEFKSCKGNRVLIRQVWANLLENAYKYTRGCPAAVIEVGTTVTEHGKTYFVRDNGAGFDMEYANKLFGVFQRLHREGEYEGAGIGLALVQRIVQRHGGRVWAESAVGKGAAFYFTLE